MTRDPEFRCLFLITDRILGVPFRCQERACRIWRALATRQG